VHYKKEDTRKAAFGKQSLCIFRTFFCVGAVRGYPLTTVQQGKLEEKGKKNEWQTMEPWGEEDSHLRWNILA